MIIFNISDEIFQQCAQQMVIACLIKAVKLGHALILIAVATAQCLHNVSQRITRDTVYATTIKLKRKTLLNPDLNVVSNKNRKESLL